MCQPDLEQPEIPEPPASPPPPAPTAQRVAKAAPVRNRSKRRSTSSESLRITRASTQAGTGSSGLNY